MSLVFPCPWLVIEVAAEHADEARALISAARGDDARLDDSAADYEPPAVEPEQPRASFMQHLMALGLVLVFPGLASAYAGFPIVGFALMGWSLYASMGPGSGADPAASFCRPCIAVSQRADDCSARAVPR
jgi:hypothetical protein